MKNLKKQDFYFIFSDLDCFYLPLNAYVERPFPVGHGAADVRL